MDVKTYETAEALLPFTRSKLVAGATVNPVWVDDGVKFWYLNDGPEGHTFVAVEPAKRSREPAFDHARLANALEAASGQAVDATKLPFKTIQLLEKAVEFDALGAHWRCAFADYFCQVAEDHAWPNPMEVKSPDGKWAVFLRDHNLWIRALATGEERALTTDGSADYPYGSMPDCLSFGALMRKLGLPHMPPIVSWSPDSRQVFSHRTDQRNLPHAHLVEAAPSNGGPPVLHSYRYAFPGADVVPHAELVVFDAETGKAVTAKTPPILMWIAPPSFSQDWWWSPDGSAVYFIEQTRDLKMLWLKRVDPTSGEVRTLVEEAGAPPLFATQFVYTRPIVSVLPGGEEALWYSQRDGWGHLYLYDTKGGALLGQVTSGEWAVQQILHVDVAERVVYFLAAGLVKSDVYRRQVCRVGLDGKGFARLSDDDLDHVVTASPDGACFVDSASAIDAPPVITVRDWSGDELVELERADITRLLATGWTLPERFCVKAADGVTDIYGVLYRPHRLDPAELYPIIDNPYPGPQRSRLPPSFGDWPNYDPESVAALGFAVVALDGRGTPGRSKAFLDTARGQFGKAGFLEDHVAAIRQLAATRPWMNLDRVGVYGSSGGGYATARALLAHPEFYKVGVSLCGNHDQRLYQVSWGETFIGPLDENRDEYLQGSNADIADRLQGKLLLIHGEMDDNVHPHLTMRLVDRLIAANKDFDLLIVPGADHTFIGYLGYTARRRWDFFVRHLKGMEPPAGYRISEPPVSLEMLFG
jgi:dipeptidyl aminopeptidase/acylaminoacyl peptidase